MTSSNTFTHTNRRFLYSATPDAIRQYLAEIGYATKDVISENTAIGFDVIGTTIRVDFDIVVNNRIVANGMISVTNNAFTIGEDNEKAERSLKLYRKLYNRFRQRSRPVPWP